MNNDYKPENENGGQTPGVDSDNQQYSYRSDNQNGGYNAPGGGYGDQNRYYGQNQYGNQTGYGYQQNQYGYPGYVDESGIFSENKMKRLNGVSAKITIGDWLKTDCISLLNFSRFSVPSRRSCSIASLHSAQRLRHRSSQDIWQILSGQEY